MKVKIMVTLFAVMLLAVSAFAGDSSKVCKLQGTWIGEFPYALPDNTPNDPSDDVYYMLKFFSVFHGTGDNGGTEVTEFINPVPAPGTTWGPSARGVWEKSGPNQYKYTKWGHIYATANGTILMVVKHTGTFALTDCNTLRANTEVEYLSYPDMTSLMCTAGEVTLKRVVLEDGCQPEP